MNPTVTLVRNGAFAHGTLEGHPGELRVTTYRMGDRLAVELHHGTRLVGRGELRSGPDPRDLLADSWIGQCTEDRATWWVRGRCGSGVLEFFDRRDPAPERVEVA